MKWYSPFFCCILLVACTGRTTVDYNRTRDSLWTVANDTVRAERVRIEALTQMLALAKSHHDDSIRYVVASGRYALSYAGNPEEALSVFRAEVRQMDNPRYTSYFNAVYDSYSKDAPARYLAYSRMYQMAEQARDTSYMVYGRLQLATLENEAGDYSGCEENVTRALRLLDEKKPADAGSLESAYDLLGESYLSRDDLQKALFYFGKGLRFSTTFERRLTHENNVAFAHIRLKEYQKAIKRLAGCLGHPATQKYPRDRARLLKNIGYARFCANANQGEAEMKEALAIREQQRYASDLPSSYLDLAEFYVGKDRSRSRNYAEQAYKVATTEKQADDRVEALRFLTRVTDGAAALHAYRTLTVLDDSLRTLRRKARNEFAHIRYEKSQVERRNQQLAHEKQRQKWIALAWAAFALAVAAVGSFLVYRFRKQKQIEAYQTETRLSRRIHDEVAGDLSKMMAFAETADLAHEANREKLLSGLDTVYGRTRDIAHANADIATGDGFAANLRELMEVFQGQARIITVGFEAIPWSKLSVPQQVTVYRVVQEMLTNMRKHSDADLVTLRFAVEKRALTVDYIDNGSRKGEETGQNGLRNAENRITAVKGHFTFGFEDGKGFRASFTIPL